MKKVILLLTAIFFSGVILNAQTITQNIRGEVVDAQTRKPLPFASVIILDSNPVIGTTSNN